MAKSLAWRGEKEDNLFIHKFLRKGRSSMKHSIASTQEEMPKSPANQIIALLLNVLSAGSVSAPTTAVTRGRGRPATLSHDHLWLAMLQTMLQGSTSFASLWRLITWTGIGHLPILDLTRDAVRKRLLHAKLDSLHDLLARVSQAVLPWTTQVQDRDLAPFATRILALDQSTLDAVRRTCQDVREEPVESARLLVGKLAALFDIQRQQWVRVLFREDVFANEKLFVEELLAGIQKEPSSWQIWAISASRGSIGSPIRAIGGFRGCGKRPPTRSCMSSCSKARPWMRLSGWGPTTQIKPSIWCA